jgi:hypothetical protein
MSEQREHETAWNLLAREGKLADAVAAYVEHYDWVTFVEIERLLEPFIPTRGTLALEIAPNTIMWADMSEEFCAVMHEIQERKLIWPHGVSLLSYLADGGVLTLPLAKRPSKKGYVKERWLPIAFRVVQS